jgi:hypothetical protein
MKLNLTRKQLDSTKKDGGLNIFIPGVLGDPTYVGKIPCPIFIEEHEGKIKIHVWDGQEVPITITLTNKG